MKLISLPIGDCNDAYLMAYWGTQMRLYIKSTRLAPQEIIRSSCYYQEQRFVNHSLWAKSLFL